MCGCFKHAPFENGTHYRRNRKFLLTKATLFSFSIPYPDRDYPIVFVLRINAADGGNYHDFLQVFLLLLLFYQGLHACMIQDIKISLN